MSEPIKIWGIAVLAPAQKPAVDAHCFGDCGKISMAGAINDDLTGWHVRLLRANVPLHGRRDSQLRHDDELRAEA